MNESWLWYRSKSLLPVVTDQSSAQINNEDTRWKLTVSPLTTWMQPNMWKSSNRETLPVTDKPPPKQLNMYSLPSYLTNTNVIFPQQRRSSLLDGYQQTLKSLAVNQNLSIALPKQAGDVRSMSHHSQVRQHIPVPIPPAKKFHLTGRLYGYLEKQKVIEGVPMSA